jgi:hypothetical protein
MLRPGEAAPQLQQDGLSPYTTNLTAALPYADRGWPVLPLHTIANGKCTCNRDDCPTSGKHPLTKHGVKDATTDAKIIRQWWRQWPRANIGIACGNGLVVLDIDPRNGGDESLVELEAQFGPLPHTVEALTGGGGRHIYLNDPTLTICSCEPLPGVEIKALGSLVVAPPSLHRSGRLYEWEVAHHPQEMPLTDVPHWLIDLAQKIKTKHIAVSPVSKIISPGKRNATLASLAGSMRRRGMEEPEILAGLREFNQRRCLPEPLADDELVGIVQSIIRYAPEEVPFMAETQSKSMSSSSFSLSSNDNDYNATQINLLSPIQLSDLTEPPPRAWLWEGRIPDQVPSILYGDGGLAKSYLALLIAIHIARGEMLFGGAVRQGGVLYIDFELDVAEQTRRAYRVARGLGFPHLPNGIYYLQPEASLTELVPLLDEYVRTEEITLIIVDSFGLALAGDLTAAKDVIPLLRKITALPCATLFIDHSRNPQMGETAADLSPFGSAYKRHLCRSILQVVKAESDDISLSIIIRATKANFSALAQPLSLRVNFEEKCVTFEQQTISDADLAAVAAPISASQQVLQALESVEDASPADLAKATGLKEGTVKNNLTQLGKLGKVAKAKRGRWRAVQRSSSSSFNYSENDNDDKTEASPQHPPRSMTVEDVLDNFPGANLINDSAEGDDGQP